MKKTYWLRKVGMFFAISILCSILGTMYVLANEFNKTWYKEYNYYKSDDGSTLEMDWDENSIILSINNDITIYFPNEPDPELMSEGSYSYFNEENAAMHYLQSINAINVVILGGEGEPDFIVNDYFYPSDEGSVNVENTANSPSRIRDILQGKNEENSRGFDEEWYKTYHNFVDMNGNPVTIDWYDDGTFSVYDVDYEMFFGSSNDYEKDSEGTYIYRSYMDEPVLRYYPEKGNCVSIKYRGSNSYYYYPILENGNDMSIIYPEHDEFYEDWFSFNNTYMDYCADEFVTFEYYDDGSVTGTINDTTLIHISKFDYEINEKNGYVYPSTFPEAQLIYYPYHGNQIEYVCDGVTTYYYPIATYLFE